MFDLWMMRFGMRRGAINLLGLDDRQALVAANKVRYSIKRFEPQLQFLPVPHAPPHHDYPPIHYDRMRYVAANHPEYGPLLQWFTEAAEQLELSESTMCKMIRDWSLSDPPLMLAFRNMFSTKAWKTMVLSSDRLVPFFQENTVWYRTNDLMIPWASRANGIELRLRINDFPDERLYTLMVGGDTIGDFNDFPSNWKHSKRLWSKVSLRTV